MLWFCTTVIAGCFSGVWITIALTRTGEMTKAAEKRADVTIRALWSRGGWGHFPSLSESVNFMALPQGLGNSLVLKLAEWACVGRLVLVEELQDLLYAL